jgi:hypothetical protein
VREDVCEVIGVCVGGTGGGFKYCWGLDSIGINSCYYYKYYYYLNYQYVISVATVILL